MPQNKSLKTAKEEMNIRDVKETSDELVRLQRDLEKTISQFQSTVSTGGIEKLEERIRSVGKSFNLTTQEIDKIINKLSQYSDRIETISARNIAEDLVRGLPKASDEVIRLQKDLENAKSDFMRTITKETAYGTREFEDNIRSVGRNLGLAADEVDKAVEKLQKYADTLKSVRPMEITDKEELRDMTDEIGRMEEKTESIGELGYKDRNEKKRSIEEFRGFVGELDRSSDIYTGISGKILRMKDDWADIRSIVKDVATEDAERLNSLYASLGNKAQIQKMTWGEIVDKLQQIDKINADINKKMEDRGELQVESIEGLEEYQRSQRAVSGYMEREEKKRGAPVSDVMRGLGGVPGLEMVGKLGGLLAGGFSIVTVMDAIAQMVKVMDSYITRQLEAQRTFAAPGIVPERRVTMETMMEMPAAVGRAGMPQLTKEEIEKMIHPQLQYSAELFLETSNDIFDSSKTMLQKMDLAMKDPAKYGEEFKQSLITSSIGLLKFSEVTGISIQDIVSQTQEFARLGAISGTIESGREKLAQFAVGAKDANVTLSDYVNWTKQAYGTMRFFNMDIDEAQMIIHKWSDELKAGIFTVEDLNDAMMRAKGAVPLEDLAIRFQLLGDILEEEGSPALRKVFDYMKTEGAAGLKVWFGSLLEGKDAMKELKEMYPDVYKELEKQVGGYKNLTKVSDELGGMQGRLKEKMYEFLGATTTLDKAFIDMEVGVPGFGTPTTQGMTIEQWAQRFEMEKDILEGSEKHLNELERIQKDAVGYLESIDKYVQDKPVDRKFLEFWAKGEEWVSKNPEVTKDIVGAIDKLGTLLAPQFFIPMKKGVEFLFSPTPTQPTERK